MATHKTQAPQLTAEDVNFARNLFQARSQTGVRSSVVRCYLDAGFPDRGSEAANRMAAHRRVKKREFRELYRQMQQRAADAAQVDLNRIVQALARIAFGNRKDLFDEHGQLLPIDQWPESVQGVVDGVENEEIWGTVPVEGEPRGRRMPTGVVRKIRFCARMDALRLLCQLLRLVGPDAADANQTAYPPMVIYGGANPGNL